MKLTKIAITIRGVSPLLMHSSALVDPLNPKTRALSAKTSKRKKTDEDKEEIRRLEWEAGMYHDPELGPYIPSEWVESCIRDGAKKDKRGKIVTSALLTDTDRFALSYDGPRDLEGLWAARKFCDVRPVTVQRAKTMRSRPRFDDWSLCFTVAINANELDVESVRAALDNAGLLVGIGDYRPKFGRFLVEAFEVQS